MLSIVNESLFSFFSEEGSNNYGAFSKLSINTSTSIVKRSENDNTFLPSVRTFAKLVSPDKDYHQHNLAVSTKYLENERVQILFKCTPEVKYDSTIYVVAFPFNGIIKPIPESDQFRILKGIVSVSDQYSVSFGNRKFKKVLYLIITPKTSLFNDKDNPVQSIPITFHSYSYNKNRDNSTESTSTHESMTVNMEANGYNVEWKREIIPSISMEEYKGYPLFTIYRKPVRDENTQRPQNVSTRPHQTTFEAAFANSRPAVSQNRNSVPYGGYKDKDDEYDNKNRNSKKVGNGNKQKARSRRPQ